MSGNRQIVCLAVVLLVMSFAAHDMLSLPTALALILGANLGTAINPLLEGATGNNPAGRRVPIGNLLNRVVSIVLGLVLLLPAGNLLMTIEPTPARAVADFHTVFNVVSALLFLPILKPYAALLRRFLPDRIDPADPSQPQYLDKTVQEIPALALGAAALEALRMTDVLQSMLEGFRDALDNPDRRQIDETKRADDILDGLNAAIKTYLIALDPGAFSEQDNQRVTEILTFATNIEQAGDIVDRNLLGLASKKMKRGLAFSRQGKQELLELADNLIANTQQAASLFVTGDARAARMLANEKEAFRQSEDDGTLAHFERLRSGQVETAETSALHLDLLRDMKQVNSHLVAAAAYPVLERHRELLPSRVSDGRSSD